MRELFSTPEANVIRRESDDLLAEARGGKPFTAGPQEGDQEMVGDTERWSIRRLDSSANIAVIDCGGDPWGQSVTDFLVEDALEQQVWLMSKTTLFYYDKNVIGYVTLAASVLELNPNPPKDGLRKAEGGVRELQGK